MITNLQTVKTLADLFDFSGEGEPTTATEGTLHSVYMDEDTGKTWELESIADGPIYNWVQVQGDAKIELFIQRAESDYEVIRGLPFGETYPDEAGLTAGEMVCYLMGLGDYLGRGNQAESLSGRSATYDQKINGYPVSIVGGIERFQRLS